MEQNLDPFLEIDGDKIAERLPARVGKAPAECAHRRSKEGRPPRPRARCQRAPIIEQSVTTDMPGRIRPLSGELALWRAFLADEIEAILWVETDRQ